MKPIYLDYNATTPLDMEVKEVMIQIINDDLGNPSSSNYYGTEVKARLEKARRQVAELVGGSAEEIFFTSGGTEANNLAIRGLVYSLKDKGNHIIISSVEHPAVTEVCKHLEREGFVISRIPVDEYGIVLTDELEKLINGQTILISVMHSNNETGSLQPITEIAKIAEAAGIYVHTDAAQSAGKIEVDAEKTGAHLISLAGHKFYAPSGVGALYIRKGTPMRSIFFGAGQERGLRPGTQNLPGIVAMGKAAEIARRDLPGYMTHLAETRDRLYKRLSDRLLSRFDSSAIKINGHHDLRLPNTLNISFRHINSSSLASLLFDKVAFSCGAACHSGDKEISEVLRAMNVKEEYAVGTIRLSTGKHTTIQEVDTAADLIAGAIEQLTLNSNVSGVDIRYSKESCTVAKGAITCQAMKEGEKIVSAKEEEIKLTHFTAGLGCACKLEPSVLEAIVKQLPVLVNEKILVGPETSDDAAVYKIDDDKALVLTLDFFNPIVDDPRSFGVIAACNSLSDIYAMGAEPLFALNIVGFPIDRLPAEVLSEILAGAIEKTNEAGIPILGGHTIKDVEPKYGLAVAGIVHPDKIYTNNSAAEGDAVILTKPLGVGIITSALKKGIASPEEKEAAVITMAELNKYAADVLKDYPVNCCTDITGFGLLGHLSEVVVSSEVEVTIYAEKIPRLAGLDELIAKGVTPGGIFTNMEFHDKNVIWGENISENDKYILFDAQTSGGLLVFMPREKAEEFIEKLRTENRKRRAKGGKQGAESLVKGIENAAIIGTVTGKGKGKIIVR